MITAIFEKSKPINLILASAIVVFGFLVAQFYFPIAFNRTYVVYLGLKLIIAILSVLIVDFIVKKNTLSEQNSFVILFFSFFFAFFWNAEENTEQLYASFFILLSLRKIISLKSSTAITKKIFDAALWIGVATLFSFWSILFLLVLYLGILTYARNYYKNWLVPLISLMLVFVITNTYQFCFYGMWYEFPLTTIDTNFSLLFKSDILYVSCVFSLIILISLLFIVASIKDKTQKNKSSYSILFLALIISIGIIILSPDKNSVVFVFMYFPLAVLFNAFFEKIKKPWLQSTIIYSLLILSFLRYIL